jgi:hypothetical protein
MFVFNSVICSHCKGHQENFVICFNSVFCFKNYVICFNSVICFKNSVFWRITIYLLEKVCDLFQFG